MRKTFHLFLLLAACALVVTACARLGRVQDAYFNEKNPKKSLVFTSEKGTFKQAVAGVIHKQLVVGEFTLVDEQKVSSGRFKKTDEEYVLTPDGDKEWKVRIEPDDSLRDADGGLWRHAEHSVSMR